MLSLKKYGLLVLAISLLIIVICYLRDILIPFFLAISIAYLFHPLVTYFEKKQFSRTIAIILVYISLTITVVLLVFGIFPILYREVNILIIEIPTVFTELEKNINNYYGVLTKNSLPVGLKKIITSGVLRTETKLLEELKAAITALWSAVTYLPLIALTPFLAFYFLNDSQKFALKLIRLFPEKHHRKITAFLHDVNTTLMHYIRGEIAVCFLVAILTTIGLYIIKIPMAAFLGVLAGAAELIPFLGPFISGVIIILFAITISKQKAFLAFLVFVIIQQLESNVITPKILGESVGFHPLVIIFLILLGGKYFGIMGMLFVVPLFAVIRIIFNHTLPFIRELESN